MKTDFDRGWEDGSAAARRGIPCEWFGDGMVQNYANGFAHGYTHELELMEKEGEALDK